MPHHGTQVEKLPDAFALIKDMDPDRFGEDTRHEMRLAVASVLEARMSLAVDKHLAEMEARGEDDRRNGAYSRHLLTSLGDVLLEVPRTRTYAAHEVIGTYARRQQEIDQTILRCFLFGHSTRKVSKALLPMLGEQVSASTVSRIAKTLDKAVEAFHQRPLKDRYRALLFDGVVLARKTGAGALKRPVLVALGLLPDGKKEVIDFRLALSESEREWETFLNGLVRRGLTGSSTELVVVDGGQGLRSALDTVLPHIHVQRCWAHKTRNLTDKVRKADREAVKRSLRLIYLAATVTQARKAARRFADRWEATYPAVVRSLRNDLDDLLAFFVFKDEQWRIWTRTTNAIERRFREVRRRTRPMGVFSDRTSMERILFAVFTYENQQQGVVPLFSLTQNS
jgi:putative transposase